MTEERVEDAVEQLAPDVEEPAVNDPAPDDENLESFPRDYVMKLRDENAKYRQRAADRDEVAARLHAALVAATGRLHDPSDLPFADEHLTDPGALTVAIDELLQAKPHLASRRPTGNIGQGVVAAAEPFSLSAVLKANAS